MGQVASSAALGALKAPKDKHKDQRQELQRNLSQVSHRNIQLLSMRPRGERDQYADGLRSRRRSSLINLILGAPSSGPRFCDDLCSLGSRLSYFGIEYFEPPGGAQPLPEGAPALAVGQPPQQQRRRSSLGSIGGPPQTILEDPTTQTTPPLPPPHPTQGHAHQARAAPLRQSSVASALASIDLGGSLELPADFDTTAAKARAFAGCPPRARCVPRQARVGGRGGGLRRSGSELSLYSYSSGSSSSTTLTSTSSGTLERPYTIRSRHLSQRALPAQTRAQEDKDTRLIIMLQVCLPFMFAGFGNMLAGLALSRVAQLDAFVGCPLLVVLLPPLICLKGNIEMTLASRLSTLANLNLLDSTQRLRRAYVSNLLLVSSQALGLTMFAVLMASLCELALANASSHLLGAEQVPLGALVAIVLASGLLTSLVLALISTLAMLLAILAARCIQVNPDNLSTLLAALYGDPVCVLVYGHVANWLYSGRLDAPLVWPSLIVGVGALAWPLLLWGAHRVRETRDVAFSSIPPMVASILISLGSGALLSSAVARYRLIAMLQPIVNGFSANLIAAQASRVSTWLWCSAIKTMTENHHHQLTGEGALQESKGKAIGSLASFVEPPAVSEPAKPDQAPEGLAGSAAGRALRALLWSFLNESPNAVAARLLLCMIVPAQSLYFVSIWLLSNRGDMALTWHLYLCYVSLCLVQVFVLLAICEPLMSLLMSHNLDPDIFGISILMSLADLTGTISLTGAFALLGALGDPNASL